MMRRVLLALVVLTEGAAFAQAPVATPDPLAPLQFLLGEWVADSASGGGSGWFSFTPDLNGKVVVRKNHSENPSQSGRTAVHDDLMIIYPEKSGLRADFFDSEGHAIHYSFSSAAPGTVVFLSDLASSAPRFRLTYTSTAANVVKIIFDIAPPDHPDAFNNYITAHAHRKK